MNEKMLTKTLSLLNQLQGQLTVELNRVKSKPKQSVRERVLSSIKGPTSIGEILSATGLKYSAISAQIAILKADGLVEVVNPGKRPMIVQQSQPQDTSEAISSTMILPAGQGLTANNLLESTAH